MVCTSGDGDGVMVGLLSVSEAGNSKWDSEDILRSEVTSIDKGWRSRMGA